MATLTEHIVARTDCSTEAVPLFGALVSTAAAVVGRRSSESAMLVAASTCRAEAAAAVAAAERCQAGRWQRITRAAAFSADRHSGSVTGRSKSGWSSRGSAAASSMDTSSRGGFDFWFAASTAAAASWQARHHHGARGAAARTANHRLRLCCGAEAPCLPGWRAVVRHAT